MLTDIIGWTGTACVLLAYLLVSMRKIKPSTPAYQLLNLIGAGALILHTFAEQAIPSMALNIAWLGIALYGLIRGNKSK
jgi:hypothetical protein